MLKEAAAAYFTLGVLSQHFLEGIENLDSSGLVAGPISISGTSEYEVFCFG
jgi:hypothetical protein